MRVLAVNGSPKGKHGNTEHLMHAFVKGAEQAGATVDTVYLRDKDINHCLGCYSCWGKTPGVCAHKDDMAELLELRRFADVLVLATPLYVYTVSGLMKDFMDRGLPLSLPYVVKAGDGYAHPRRYPEQPHTKVVLISNCGFPSRKYFTGLLESFRVMCSGPHSDLAGSILCSAGGALSIPQARSYVQWYLDACEAAGRDVVTQGAVSAETQKILDRDLMDDVQAYIDGGNQYFEQLLNEKMPQTL